jgi:hypothetical protein
VEEAGMERSPRYLYANLHHATTDELLGILKTNDRDMWTEADFDVIRQILREREVGLSPQGELVDETGRTQGDNDALTDSELRWAPVALNFVLALIANVLIMVVAVLNRYHGQGTGYQLLLLPAFSVFILPVSALILGIGALAGARRAKEVGDSPTTGAVVGMWIGAIPATGLSVSILLAIGPGD